MSLPIRRVSRRQKVFDPSDPALFFAGQNEGQLQHRLEQFCLTLGHLHFHPYSSRRSAKGYPDSTIVRLPAEWEPPWVWFIELKAERGTRSPMQIVWGTFLEAAARASGGALEYRVVKPSGYDELCADLQRGRRD